MYDNLRTNDKFCCSPKMYHFVRKRYIWSSSTCIHFGNELTSRPRQRDDQGDELTSHRTNTNNYL